MTCFQELFFYLTLTHPHTYTHTLFISLTISHTLPLSLSHTPAHPLSRTLSFSLSLSHTHFISHYLTHTHSLSVKRMTIATEENQEKNFLVSFFESQFQPVIDFFSSSVQSHLLLLLEKLFPRSKKYLQYF